MLENPSFFKSTFTTSLSTVKFLSVYTATPYALTFVKINKFRERKRERETETERDRERQRDRERDRERASFMTRVFRWI